MHDDQSIIGTVIDGYRILEIIGRGGMGIVYRAEDVALSRIVALKMIAPEMAENETFLKRFRAEARALARVDSPYIVGIHAMRHSEQRFFIVMEYVEGGTLFEEIAEGPMSPETVAPIVRQMLLAFSNAHSVGVIHRDIKPRNIMLTPAGRVKVTDFGLAKLRREDDATTATQGGMAGTLRYMSPEQVRNEQVDHRSDLYSLGMTLYEMLAGVLPYNPDEGAYAILKRIVEDSVPPPTDFYPDIPEGWVRIVEKAIAKNPVDRFQNAEEMLEAVDILMDESAPAPPPAFAAVQPAPPPASPAPRPLTRDGAEARAKLFASQAGVRPATPPVRPEAGLPARNEAPQPRRIGPPAEARIYESPPPPPPYAPPRRRKPPYTALLAGVAVVAALVIGYPIVRAAMNETPTYPVDPPAITEPARLLVTTSPQGALVLVDDRPIGVTPLDPQSASGEVRVTARLEGYAETDTTVVVEGGAVDVHLILTALARTPEEPRPVPTRPTIQPTVPPTVVPESPVLGTLRLRVEPAGTIAVVGFEDRGVGIVELPAGIHRVRCTANGVSSESEVRVEAGGSGVIMCYTEHELTIVSRYNGQLTWANILMNGRELLNEENNLESTPLSDFKLSPGTYDFHVSRHDYRPEEDEMRLVLRPVFEVEATKHILEFNLVKVTSGALRTRSSSGTFTSH